MDDFSDIDPELVEQIGAWSERKHAIIQEYSAAFTAIMANAQKSVRKFQWDYIDGYAAAGFCKRKSTGEILKGSALKSLDTDPPFSHFTFIELDDRKHGVLRQQIADRRDVECINGDTNIILPRDIIPRYEYQNYRRAFCLLDPYQHKHLDWATIAAIGRIGTIDLLLHFPTMPMNRGALHRNGDVSAEEAEAMTRFWGDTSWREAAYVKRDGLFIDLPPEKATDIEFARAFCKRLEEVAGFHGTTPPIPMLNSNGAVLYYLIFALPIERATKAANGVAKFYVKHPSATGRRSHWEDAV